MAVTNFTPLLGLALPTTGDLSGTWGTTVNDSITGLLDSAVAGTTTLSADADVTLSTTNGAANQARNAVILWTASGTVTRNITAPAQSKAYVVINSTGSTQSIVIRGAGPTTGVTIPAGTRALVAWNGSDFVKIVSNPVVLTSDVSGTLPVANGGTGNTTIPALSVPVANSLNTFTSVTATAGQSIRINAGGTAWEAYTPSTSSGSVTSVSWTGGIVSIANATTTPAFTIAGTSGGIPYFSNGTTWASSAALAANALVIGGGAGAAPATTTTGTGVVTALGVNVGSSGAFTTNNAANTFTANQTFYQVLYTVNTVTVTTNAGTVPVTYRLNNFTNSSAATMTVTMATASAVDGQMSIVRIYDFSAAAQTITWVNTENSTITVPTTSNGSTTLPLTVGFMYNSQTSKWRCIASA